MKMKWFMRSFAILAGVSLVACTDPNEGVVTPVFPDETGITLNAGETRSLTFEANTAWTLSVDTPWCFFIDGDEEVKQLKGDKAGTVTVTVKAKDTGHSFDLDATAKATLYLKGAVDGRTLYTINRPGKVREVKVYRKDGNNYTEMENGVVMAFKENRTAIQQICFTANFDWKVLSKSDEITLSDLTGTAGQAPAEATSSYIQLATSVLHAPYTGEIVISDPAGINKIAVPVTYPGMGDEDLFFSAPYLRAGSSASVNFSNKGYVMGRGSGEGPTEDMSLAFSAISKGMKSKGYIVTLDENNSPSIATNPWLVLNGDETGNYTISIAGNGVNLGEARTLHVFILPESLATATPDFTQWFTDGVSKGIYTFSVSQAAAPSGAGAFLAWQGGASPVAEDKIMTWVEFTDYMGGTWIGTAPGDMGGPYGLASENAIVYEFAGTDIDGDFLIAVMGLEVSGFNASAPGTHVSNSWTAGTYEGLYSVSTSAIADFTEGAVTTRQTWISFSKQGSYTPQFGVLLRQKKTVVK